MPGCHRIHEPSELCRNRPGPLAGPFPILLNPLQHGQIPFLRPPPELGHFFISAQHRLHSLDPFHERLFGFLPAGQPFRLVPDGLYRQTQGVQPLATRCVECGLDQACQILFQCMTQIFELVL